MMLPQLQPPAIRPELSVILVTDRYETIRKVISHLRQQTVRDKLEIVIVAPKGQALEFEPFAFQEFAAVRLIEADSVLPLAEPRAAGVRVASAPIVVIGETHAYPHPEWAEALIKAH